VAYLFARKGVFTIPSDRLPGEEQFLEAMIEAGAEDVELGEGAAIVTCAYEDFGSLQEVLEKLGIEPEEASLAWVPSSYVQADWEEAQKALRLIEQLEEHEDVQKVYHNLALTDEIAAKYAEAS
jgi:transcriptional/translational regulatory protein YebC/TACO1